MNINRQTRIWANSHSSLMGIIAVLSVSGCITTNEPNNYDTCEPTPPATDCGDDVTIVVE